MLALQAYRNEKGNFPASLVELNAWWKKGMQPELAQKTQRENLGQDLFSVASMRYEPDLPKHSSAGFDGNPDTPDDIIFLSN